MTEFEEYRQQNDEEHRAIMESLDKLVGVVTEVYGPKVNKPVASFFGLRVSRDISMGTVLTGAFMLVTVITMFVQFVSHLDEPAHEGQKAFNIETVKNLTQLTTEQKNTTAAIRDLTAELRHLRDRTYDNDND